MSDVPPQWQGEPEAEYVPGLIGVPQEGYRPPGSGGGNKYVGPRYRDGDQFLGANRTPDEIANLQRSLQQAGFLHGRFRIGAWMEETAIAFEGLLAFANQLGVPWQTALRRAIEQGGIDNMGGSDGSSGGLPVTISDPATLRTTFRETAAAMRGQGFSDAEYDAMVAAYQAVERRAQERQYDLAQGAVGDERYEIVNPPSPQAWAEEEVRRRDPSGVMSRDVLDRMDQFFSLIQAGAPVQPG